MRHSARIALSLAFLAWVPATASAQPAFSRWAANIVVPQARVFPIQGQRQVEITGVDAYVEIAEQLATTRLDIALRNSSPQPLESELWVPVPENTIVRGFDFLGTAAEPQAKLLPKAEALRIYHEIVAKVRDPALLEFVGHNLVRSAVFPVPVNGTQKVRLIYESLLPADGDRIDYVLPRSERVDYAVPWTIRATIRHRLPISTVYSPSHEIITSRDRTSASGSRSATTADVITLELAPGACREPGPFILSYLLTRGGPSASLYAYPDTTVQGGYFLLLLGLPAAQPEHHRPVPREITLVVDHSGSMRGEKWAQTRAAALEIVGTLSAGESFNLLTYNETVNAWATRPRPVSAQSAQQIQAYLDGVQVGGGTNLYDALQEALRQPPTPGTLPIVLFMTDGLPTIGRTAERDIHRLVAQGNPYQRRVFSIGVGTDINSPLLDRIARQSRAVATFVVPGEDVAVKMAQVFRRTSGPVLANPSWQTTDAQNTPGRVRDVLPTTLPDLFDGDQLVLLGRYQGDAPLHLRIQGEYLGISQTFDFSFALDHATTRNAFVPRLWASRRIAVLIDGIRDRGADSPHGERTDPGLRELVDEIVRLSTEFGILTEYTAFLAQDGSALADPHLARAQALEQLKNRAVQARTGAAAVNQELNQGCQRSQKVLNRKNRYANAQLAKVEIHTVQQISDRTYFRQGARWIDSKLVQRPSAAQSARVVEFGTPGFDRLVRELVDQGRQGILALRGEVLMENNGAPLLVKGPTP